jgi:putative transposase
MAQRLMDADVQALVGAGPGERSETRENWRNGYCDRVWHTRAGTVPLKIPKLHSGSYFPGFLEPRRSSEKAMAAVIQEAYVHGVCGRLLRSSKPVFFWHLYGRSTHLNSIMPGRLLQAE